jgi:hypothetical protein
MTNRNPIYTVQNYTDNFGLDMPKDCLVYCLEDDTLWVITVDSNLTHTLGTVSKRQLNPGVNIEQQIPTGSVLAMSTSGTVNGFLLCDSTAISRATYNSLYDVISPSRNITISIASPAVITLAGHGLVADTIVEFFTDGTLPTGISTNTTYYVLSTGMTTDSFRISTSKGGSAVNTSGTQIGTHSIRHFMNGNGNGSTTFNLPDGRGAFLRMSGSSSLYYKARDTGSGTRYPFTGGALGSFANDKMFRHRHNIQRYIGSGTSPSVSWTDIASTYGDTLLLRVDIPVSDGINGTPRAGDETAPFHWNLNFYIKT